MSNRTISIISLLVIIAVPVGLFSYWRLSRPHYEPLPPRPEVTITILPGWNLRQVAEYLIMKGLATTTADVYKYTGEPAKKYTKDWNVEGVAASNDFTAHPENVSLEGYLAPETYRVFADATTKEVVVKLLEQRNSEVDPVDVLNVIKQTGRSWHQILTMASVVEKEAKTGEDMAMVADIFWRRLKMNWALQSCATVNYVTGKSSPAVSGADKAIDSPYNTYKYPGLPPGPISNPGLKAITAVLHPTANNNWYFMSGTDGVMHYAKTLDEHNVNVDKYLR